MSHSASGAGIGRAALNLIVKDFKSQTYLLTLKPLKSDFTNDCVCNRYLQLLFIVLRQIQSM